MTHPREIIDCPTFGWHAYLDGMIHDGPAAGCEVCKMEDARRAKLGLTTSANVAIRQTGVPLTGDDTCTRSMQVPAARSLAKDELRKYAQTAPEVPYDYPPHLSRRHVLIAVAIVLTPWAIVAALAAWIRWGGP